MRKQHALLIAAVTLFSATAEAQTVLSVGPRPESVIKGWGGKYYVSIQGAGAVGLNDGQIRTIDIDTGAVEVFVTGLDNPRGLGFSGRHMFVTDTTRVWIIEEDGSKSVLADPSSFPNPSEIAFLNDARAEKGGQAVYVTEMGARTLMRDPMGFLWPVDSPQGDAIPARSKVWRIALDGSVSEVVSPSREVLVMNGVTEAKHGGHLLAAEFFYGNIVDISLNKDEKTIIATGFRGADGVEQDTNTGTIYVSSFELGAVWKMDRDGGNVVTMIDNVGRFSTADLYLDEKAKIVLVPDTLHGTIIVLPAGE
jgi:hypothetical protein